MEDGWISGSELASGIGRGEVGITGEVTLFENVVPEGETILNAERVTPVVAGATELRGAGEGFEEPFVGLHAEIEAAETEGFLGDGRGDFYSGGVTGMMAAVGPVNMVVEPPAQAIDTELLVAFLEAGEENFFDVGLAVAGAVFGINDIGGGGDEDAFPPAHDAGWEVEISEEEGGLVENTIAIGIGEQTHASSGSTVEAGRVVGHFGDPELPVGRPVNGNRVLHQGFGCHELDLVAIGNVNGLEGIGRRERFGDLSFGGKRSGGEFYRSVMIGNFPGSEGAVEKSGVVEVALKIGEVVDATAEEELGVGVGVSAGEGCIDFRFGVAVQEDADALALADHGEVVPAARFEDGFAGEELLLGVPVVDNEAAVGGVGAADAEVVAVGGLQAIYASGEEVGGDGAFGVGQAVAKPEGDGVGVTDVWDVGGEAFTGEVVRGWFEGPVGGGFAGENGFGVIFG